MTYRVSKLRFVGLPFVGLSAAVLVGYSALHWALLVNAPEMLPDGELVRFFFPLVLPWVPILLWLGPRIKCLRWYRDASAGYLLAWMAAAAPAICAQFWVEAVAGSLTVASRPEQIDLAHPTRFYAFDEITVDKNAALAVVHTQTSGKHSEYWTIIVDLAAPLGSSPERTSHPAPVWLGVRYERTTRSTLNAEERSREMAQFREAVMTRFAQDAFRRPYFSVCSDRKQRQALLAAANESPRRTGAAMIVLLPHDTAFELRGRGAIQWTAILFLGGSTLWCVIVSLLRIDTANYRRWNIPDGEGPIERLRRYFGFLVPTRTYLVTPLLIGTILVMWAAMAWSGDGLFEADGKSLLSWGAVYGPLVKEGEYWRLLTGMFVHASALHLVNNLFGLFCAGAFVERRFGFGWLVTTFFFGGVGGSLWSIWWSPERISVGASGGIFGVAGFALLLILTQRQRFARERGSLLAIAAIYFGLNLLVGLLPSVDLAAHIGGTMVGVLIGIVGSFFIPNHAAKEHSAPHLSAR